MSLLQLPPLSLYVHIPWCIKKCPYCDFNSHEAQQIPEQAYVDTLAQDLRQEQVLAQGRKLRSIFFGGGTPSIFSADAIGHILHSAEKIIGFETDIEITLEANPGTFEQKKFADFFSAGVNRLSIGIQSFQTQQLQHLGRIHSGKQAIAAVDVARQAGFNNINLDLMHGLPEQTPDKAAQDLNTAIVLAPEHISWYQLTIEPNTLFYRQAPQLPDNDTLADIQTGGQTQLAQAGYQQYEISAFSLARQPSQHNLNYWRFGDYLGIGAGAHGKITDIHHRHIIRRHKTRMPQDYLSNHNSVKAEPISQEELPLEFMMNTLRLKQGTSRTHFEQCTGLPFNNIQPICDNLVEKNLLKYSHDNIIPTPLGQRFLNTLLAEFIPSSTGDNRLLPSTNLH